MSEPFIELPDKDADDLLDYQIDMAEFVVSPYHVDSETVEIEAAGNGESPISLTVEDVGAASGCGGPSRPTAVLFWLRGGTRGVRYRGKVTVSDDAELSPDRLFTKWFYVVVS